MENPFSWTDAERIVQEVLDRRDVQERTDALAGDFRCGVSLPMEICNALRAAGLLGPYVAPDTSHLTVQVEPARFGPEVVKNET